ncbi:histone H1-like [Vigna unguiculata]|uniref:Histone H1/5 n=1 Tax=Vigna unguiculata TaxID=3917 RepID=A0A4D6N106_VIGUN|nr:histone H1-like [Vigna unguiculata]QCE07436.1 histone H1/5 [Vigna unguiculata]
MSTAKVKKTAAAAKKPFSHPTFAVMIAEAITSLKERTGSSQYAITKFIEGKHKELPPTYKKLVLIQLKKSVAAGKLVKVKNSFKLAPTKPAAAPAKAAVAAPKKPKSVTKTTTKAASTAAKKKPAAKPKSKTAVAAAKPKAKPAKKVVAKPAKKTPVKAVKKPKSVVKKPKSVKSPAKKAKK